jgi:hypothetical protein
MPGKTQTPAPIDRPLSRAYLREFSGWSTAYVPGMSDPTSLRLMENVMINRDGSCRVRPGLRYLNYETPPVDPTPGLPCDQTTPLLGSHEPFYNDLGLRCYLYAVREVDGSVGFRVFASIDATGNYEIQTLAEAGFDVPQTEAVLNFSVETTYVKYVQIDNKIFALSNAGESMRMFFVGEEKLAKRLFSIDRPEWNVDDKPLVVQPDAAWVGNGTPIDTRVNYVPNPSFENDLRTWAKGNGFSKISRTSALNQSGLISLKAVSLPTRTNVLPRPLNDVAGATGIADWIDYGDISTLSITGSYAHIRILHGQPGGYADSPKMDCSPKTNYRVGFTKGTHDNMDRIAVWATYYDNAGHVIGADHRKVDNDLGLGGTGARKQSDVFTTPAGCVQMRIGIGGFWTAGGPAYIEIKDVYVGESSEGDTTALDGSDGTNYFWEGATNNSASVYHPPKNVVVVMNPVGLYYTAVFASAYVRSDSTVQANIGIEGYYVTGESSEGDDPVAGLTPSESHFSADSATSAAAWTRLSTGFTLSNAGTAASRIKITFKSVARGNAQYLDAVLYEKSATLKAYFDGDTIGDSTHKYTWNGAPHYSRSTYKEYALPAGNPSAETPDDTPGPGTLIAADDDLNLYSFGFFYTFSNEIGESAPSQITVVRTKRPWGSWKWYEPDASGIPDHTKPTKDPTACADQLVVTPPHEAFDVALASGAIAWSLYMFTWGPTDAYPTTANLIAKEKLDVSSDWAGGVDSYIRATPQQPNISVGAVLVPTANTLFNSTKPSAAGQGLVAADRMVLVYDPVDAAVIRWTSNQQGNYENFSPLIGGGLKTLTSGNLMIPAVVKLWQNPQSVDTLTILCLGTDGYSTGYYMAPAQVASQTEAVNIMGFEETTATPGTTSPYGCEVLNNALYHPLDEHLLKSVASNYNINHTPLTDLIADVWRQLDLKEHIVSSQHDNRLYYLVNNPEGAPLEDGCWGNEVWVYDAAQKQGSWSRWLVQAQSLRKMRQGGQVVMSITHPTGIYYFDPEIATDDFVDVDGNVASRPIAWMLETNTQGANRAHDAWCNLQQANLRVGFFQGVFRYGIRGKDAYGKDVDVSKLIRDTDTPGVTAWDLEDFMLIRKIMREWFFYAESITIDDNLQYSSGQITYLQYRYTPVSVNIGYEYGTVESFEYGRSGLADDERNVVNGVPKPYIASARPGAPANPDVPSGAIT